MNELNKALAGMWDSLTVEQKEKAKECNSVDELMILAGRAGMELPDEMLECVTGGSGGTPAMPGGGAVVCPYCDNSNNGKISYIGPKTINPGGGKGPAFSRTLLICRICYIKTK